MNRITYALAIAGMLAGIATLATSCSLFESAPKSPAEVAPEARRALENACKADAAAVEAGLKKPTRSVDEACEVVRVVCE